MTHAISMEQVSIMQCKSAPFINLVPRPGLELI